LVNNVRQDQANFDVAPLVTYLDDRRGSLDWAFYAQDHYRLSDQVAVNVSGRFDRRGSLAGTLSPRVALIYDPLRATTFKVIYGRVFRFPNAYEQYYGDGYTQKRNPALEPETVNTWEAIAYRRFGSRVLVSAGAFTSRIADLVSQRVDPSDGMAMYDNAQTVRAKGLEFEVEARNRHGLAIGRASYSTQWADDLGAGAPLTNAPRHLAKVNALAPLETLNATLGLELQYVSPRLTLAGQETGSAWLANANLAKRHVLPGLDCSLGAYNLFNTAYGHPGALEHKQDVIGQDGRTFLFRLTYRLVR
jgi:outer membrane receptor for ferrienterochelin and colicins